MKQPPDCNLAPPQLAGVEVIDWNIMEERIPCDPELVSQLIVALRDECRDYLGQIRAGLGAGDLASVTRAAHTIKSSTELFGAGRVHLLALHLELLSRQGDLPESRAWAAVLETEIQRLLEALDNRPPTFPAATPPPP